MRIEPNSKPADFGAVSIASYDGRSDDLLTAGLGWEGLKCNLPPAVSTAPTAPELRRLAIYNNYRALVDTSEGGGYGVLFGPNVAPGGAAGPTPDSGKVAGIEALSCCLDESGRPASVLMVQIPHHFDPRRPALLVVPSPGSRGIYGGIAAGEWGLKRGLAVAYTDKGTGNGCHELMTDTVVLLDGLLSSADRAGGSNPFTSDLRGSDLRAFNEVHPWRYAFKHAHSRRNPEKDWGRFVLRAIEFALYVLNERFARQLPGSILRERHYTARNTRVIAFGISNGGGSVLAAAEQDAEDLIHGVVAGEPQVSLRVPDGLRITRGGHNVASFGRPLYDYLSYANLVQPCAALADGCVGSPLVSLIDPAAVEKRARRLAESGMLSGADLAERARDALGKLHAAGWEPESDRLHASHFAIEATPALTVTFANAYARSGVGDMLCGFSFATTTSDGPGGTPKAPERSCLGTLFGEGNGIPPTPPFGGIRLVYEDASGGPIDHRSGDGDLSLQGALRLRALWEGDGGPADRLRRGAEEVRLTGNLRGKPALIVHGRSDALLPVNHTSRPYFGASQIAEGEASRLSYLEVENAQHFDAFLGQIPGYADRWIPLHHYYQVALDLMWEHLEAGTSLPASQVVRTRPRGPDGPPISPSVHLGPIVLRPSEGDAISFDRMSRTVRIPD